jgi:hypothetical protein
MVIVEARLHPKVTKTCLQADAVTSRQRTPPITTELRQRIDVQARNLEKFAVGYCFANGSSNEFSRDLVTRTSDYIAVGFKKDSCGLQGSSMISLLKRVALTDPKQENYSEGHYIGLAVGPMVSGSSAGTFKQAAVAQIELFARPLSYLVSIDLDYFVNGKPFRFRLITQGSRGSRATLPRSSAAVHPNSRHDEAEARERPAPQAAHRNQNSRRPAAAVAAGRWSWSS